MDKQNLKCQFKRKGGWCTRHYIEENAKKISPFYQWRYEFELRRPVTQEEINHDPDRWECYQLGTFTTSFDTKEEIIALAKECFKMRFTGEWELWVDDCTMARTTVYQVEL